jgi:hypothetical protein
MTDYKPSELMIAWEKALRNPDLKQTNGALCKVDDSGNKSYCCLGVLEEVAGNTAKYQAPPFAQMGSYNLAFYGPTAWGETGLPDRGLIDLLFNRPVDHDPDVYRSEGNVTLGVDEYGCSVEAAELNDDYGWTFEQIADQIRLVYIDGDGIPENYVIDSAGKSSRYDAQDCF